MAGPAAGRGQSGSGRSLPSAIVSATKDRRYDGRLLVAREFTGVARQGWSLVDMSRSGIAIRAWGRATFARGERYAISLRAGAVEADVEGHVRWTRSSWYRGLLEAERQAYSQTAGFAISADLTTEQEQSWHLLRREIEQEAQLDLRLVSEPRLPYPEWVVVPIVRRTPVD